MLPLACVLITGLFALGVYHRHVTGSPWKWPYRLYEETYTKRVSPLNTLFAWTDQGQRKRTIPSLEYESSAGQMRIEQTKPVLYGVWKIVRQWWFYVGLIWTIPFCVAGACLLRIGASISVVARFARAREICLEAPTLWRAWLPSKRTVVDRSVESWNSNGSRSSTRRIAFAVVSITLVGLAILMQRSAGLPHYTAPILPLVVLLIVEGLRRMRVFKFAGIKVGVFIVSWLMWSCVLFFVLPMLTGSNKPNIRAWSLERDRIQRDLERQPRRSLVIVRYGPKHSMHDEWVYNRANVDRAQVVWARELETSRMPELLKLFHDRDVWLLEPDKSPLELRGYYSLRGHE